MKYNIFGVDVFFANYNEILDKIFSEDIRTVTCANQHYLNLAYQNRDYRKNLNSFDLIFPDGVGLKWAADLTDNNDIVRKFERINGSDIYPEIINRIFNENLSLYILGDSQIVLDSAVKNIMDKFRGIKITGVHHGYFDLYDESIIERINSSNPFLLIVGLGAPRQEEWINRWKYKLNARKIVAVGGGLRVFAGDRRRGPVWVRNIGLEWLVRLLTEPAKTWRRYIIGIPLFIYRVLKQKFQKL
jgi:N-acetylglucosaminyldiphosphoundecaprenol N-acetyl-beta-D-mannosaminyltransferase